MRALSPGAKVHSEEGQKQSEPEDLTTVAAGGAHSGDRLRIKDVAPKSKFDECGLGFLCADICDKWGATKPDILAMLFKPVVFKAGDAESSGIECVVLIACETEDLGKKLRENGVPHVICLRQRSGM